MKKSRRRTRARAAKTPSQDAPVELAFTQAEEDFFRAGATLSEVRPAESFDDLDAGDRRRGLLSWLFARRATN